MKYWYYVLLFTFFLQGSNLIAKDHTTEITIQDKAIQSMYREDVVLQMKLPKKIERADIQVLRRESGKDDFIEHVQWLDLEGYMYSELVISNATNLRYVIWNNKEHSSLYETPKFTIDKKAPELHLKIDLKDTLTLPLALQKESRLVVSISDEYLQKDSLQIEMFVDEQKITPITNQGQYVYDIKKGHSYVLQAQARDLAGNHIEYTNQDTPLVIDDQSPKTQLRLQNQECIDKTYSIYEPEKVTLYVEDANIDLPNSVFMVNDIVAPLTWQKKGDGWILEWMCEKSGRFKITYDIVDKAGNHTIGNEVIIYQDLSVPDVKIYENGKETSNLSTNVNHSQHILWNIYDDHFDETKSFIMLDDKPVSIKKVKDGNYQGEVTLLNGVHHIRTKFMDKGNRFIENDITIMIDDNAPIFIIAPIQNTTNKDVKLRFQLKEEQIALEDIEVNMIKDEEAIKLECTWEEKGKGEYEFNCDIREEGMYALSIKGKDQAGNEAVFFEDLNQVSVESYKKAFLIDKTPPIVTIQQNSMAPFIRNEQTLNLTFDDMYADLKQLHVQIKKDGTLYNGNPTLSENHMQYLFKEDGQYNVQLQMQDRAGNDAIFKQDERVHTGQISFVIDHMEPYIQISGIEDNLMVNHSLQANIKVNENNPNYCEIFVERNGVQQTYDCNKATLSFGEQAGEEGRYMMYAKAEDLAGNNVKSQPINFFIDRKKPAINVLLNDRSILDHSTYISNQNAIIDLHILDTNLARYTMQIKKDGVLQNIDQKKTNLKYKMLSVKDEKHVYDIFVEGMDSARNMVTFTTTVVIDARLPLPQLNDQVFKNTSSVLTWTPELLMNESQYNIVGYTLMHNQKVVDYVWGTPIEEDGMYVLDVLVADSAMNIAHLKEPIHFEIDHIAPIIILKQNDQLISEFAYIKQGSLTLTLQQEDINKASKEYFKELLINNERIDTWQRDENGNAFYTFQAIKGNINIKVKAVDEAGNETWKEWNLQIAYPLIMKYRIYCYSFVSFIGFIMVIAYVRKRRKSSRLPL